MTSFSFLNCSNDDDEEKSLADKVETNQDENEESEDPSRNQEEPSVSQVLSSIPLTTEEQMMTGGMNDFSLKLFSTLSAQTHQNLLVSPLSVTFLLGMLNEGAEGQTQEEITCLLNLGEDARSVSEYCRKMLDWASRLDSSTTISLSNMFYYNTLYDLSLFPTYSDALQTYYHTRAEGLDFSLPDAVEIINTFCRRQTNGLIPSIIKYLEPSAACCLLNAVYFKGVWKYQFDKKNTKEGRFTKADGTTSTVDMMQMCCDVKYTETDEWKAIVLPYGNEAYNMVVMLPSGGKSLSSLASGLSTDVLSQILNADSTGVDIQLPKFEIQNNLNLTETLSQPWGIPTAFGGNAQFTRISPDFPGLSLSVISQKSFLEVNEAGTEAAAVTIVLMETMNPDTEESASILPTFHCDHPFLYLIVEKSTGAIFFMGTYMGE